MINFVDLANLKEARKGIESRVAAKYATLVDAALTGTPTAPTAVSSANAVAGKAVGSTKAAARTAAGQRCFFKEDSSFMSVFIETVLILP